MDYLYTLYDALTSINVPRDKARAVVDAMERDMGTTIATKADLQLLRQDTGSRFELMQQETKAQFELMQQDTKAQFELMRQDTRAEFDAIRQEMQKDFALVRKDIEVQSVRTILALGSMLFLGFGALIAA